MATSYSAQNLIWKKDSLTNYHYFKKKQSLARFVSTCDEEKKEKQTLNHNYISLASQHQLRPHFLPTLDLDLLVCWKQFYPEQEVILI